MRRRLAFTGGAIYGRAKIPANARAKARRRRYFPLPIGNKYNYNQSTARNFLSKFRGMGSVTRQMPKGYASARIMPTSDGASNSYYKSSMNSHPKAKPVKRVSTPMFYSFAVSARNNGSTGQQAYKTFSTGLTQDLNAMVTQVSGYNEITDIFLDKMYVETAITNCSEASVFLDLYEVTPRYAMGNANNSGAAANEGISEASGGTASFNSIGTYPTMSRRFTTLWKIHKKYTVELSQGRTHIHKAYYQMGQKWNQSLYDVYGTGWYLPNFSKQLLIVQSGQPINDQTDKTLVSTSSTSIDIVRKERFFWYYNNPTNSLFKFTNSLSTIATEYLLDVGSGEPELLNVS